MYAGHEERIEFGFPPCEGAGLIRLGSITQYPRLIPFASQNKCKYEAAGEWESLELPPPSAATF